jgi:hypothetical protein
MKSVDCSNNKNVVGSVTIEGVTGFGSSHSIHTRYAEVSRPLFNISSGSRMAVSNLYIEHSFDDASWAPSNEQSYPVGSSVPLFLVIGSINVSDVTVTQASSVGGVSNSIVFINGGNATLTRVLINGFTVHFIPLIFISSGGGRLTLDTVVVSNIEGTGSDVMVCFYCYILLFHYND